VSKPNYQYEKRQRDLEKKKKQDEKRLKKLERKPDGDTVPAATPTDPTSRPPQGAN
jgi:hypothetical protein